MAKKLTDTVNQHEQQLAQAVRTSAQQIWQAGLGAFVKAQQEEPVAGGGEQAFARLVAAGSVLQQRVRASGEAEPGARAETAAVADNNVDSDSVNDNDSDSVGARSWDSLEQVFEDRVVRALGAIGVPSKRDLDLLAGQIARLGEQVAQLQEQLRALGGATAVPKADECSGRT